MQTPKAIYDCWKTVADKFHFLHAGTDDERREATKRGIQTIRARFKGLTGELDGSRWVCKSEHNTGWAASSKDAIGFVESGAPVTGRRMVMSIFDMINGTTRRTNPYPIPGETPREAYVLVPDDYDWIDDTGGTPQPPDSTHKYDGGANDTGICDICGQDRHADIHKIPQASQPHLYDGGEQDTGLCDICQKPRTDAIHGGTIPPPTGELEQRVTELEGQVADLQNRVTALEQAGSGMTAAQVAEICNSMIQPLGVEIAKNLYHGHAGQITGKPT